MSTLFWSWLLASVVLVALFVRGFVRAKMTPASYEWSWSPISFVSETLFPALRGWWIEAKEYVMYVVHKLFHVFFHQMKKTHDRVFGKVGADHQGTPSFFLKSIAEHQDEHNVANKEERKQGLS